MESEHKGSTISVTYYIDDLSELAEHFERDAISLRESAEHSETKRRSAELRAEARGIERCASIVGKTVIGKPPGRGLVGE